MKNKTGFFRILKLLSNQSLRAQFQEEQKRLAREITKADSSKPNLHERYAKGVTKEIGLSKFQKKLLWGAVGIIVGLLIQKYYLFPLMDM